MDWEVFVLAIAFVLFILAAFNVTIMRAGPLNLIAAGLALWIGTIILPIE